MGLFGKIIAENVGSITTALGTVVDNLFTSQEEKDKAKLLVLQTELEAQRQIRAMEIELEKAYMEDTANLRDQIKLELQSADPVVRWSRPSFLWIGGAAMFWNLILYPMILMFKVTAADVKPFILPDEFWILYGVSFGGYGVLRTIEKVRGMKNAKTAQS